jgi:hypothetical protein
MLGIVVLAMQVTIAFNLFVRFLPSGFLDILGPTMLMASLISVAFGIYLMWQSIFGDVRLLRDAEIELATVKSGADNLFLRMPPEGREFVERVLTSRYVLAGRLPFDPDKCGMLGFASCLSDIGAGGRSVARSLVSGEISKPYSKPEAEAMTRRRCCGSFGDTIAPPLHDCAR